jgi:hypothetical protein
MDDLRLSETTCVGAEDRRGQHTALLPAGGQDQRNVEG